MKYYKDSNNVIYAYELDGSQDDLIGDKIEITKEEVDAINLAKLQVDFNLLTYAEKRIREYPDLRDYLDGIVKGDQAQIQAYIDACMAVKAKYPKLP